MEGGEEGGRIWGLWGHKNNKRGETISNKFIVKFTPITSHSYNILYILSTINTIHQKTVHHTLKTNT